MAITGTNFKLPSEPPARASTETPTPTVAVTFGGRAATQVAVESATCIRCLTPVGAALGACAVAVTNLDDYGVAIPTETGSKTDGYAYELIKLVVASDLERVERALVNAFAAQVCPTAILTVDTDYDSDLLDGLNIPDTTQLPALVLQGPTMVFNPAFGGGVHTAEALLDAQDTVVGYKNRVAPVPVDLGYQITVIAGSRAALLRMMVDAVEFRRRMPYVEVQRDAGDASKGNVRFPVHITDYPRMTTAPNLSNLRTFTMGLTIRGVPLEGTRGDDEALVFERSYPAESISVGGYSTQEQE